MNRGADEPRKFVGTCSLSRCFMSAHLSASAYKCVMVVVRCVRSFYSMCCHLLFAGVF